LRGLGWSGRAAFSGCRNGSGVTGRASGKVIDAALLPHPRVEGTAIGVKHGFVHRLGDRRMREDRPHQLALVVSSVLAIV